MPDIGPNDEYEVSWNLESTDLLTSPSSCGGRGGYSHVDVNNDPLNIGPSDNIWGGDFRRIAGGVGGHALDYSFNRIFMGGGGGAGDMNDSQGGSGGRGGGIVMLTVYGEIIGEGTIEANGDDGENADGGSPGFNGKTGNDGAGGAGGGTILLCTSQTLPNLIELVADGGKGGDQVLRLGAVTLAQADGPGGGGGGGLIRVSNPHSAISVAGGLGGTTNSNFMTDFPYNGATGGAEGLSFIDLPHFDLLAEDDTICGGGATTITVDIVGNLPPGSQINWYENQYDQTSIHQGNSFITPSLTENTTYYIGVCPSTFRKPVTILVSPEIVINGPPTILDETCAGNDGSIDGIMVTGGYGQLTYEWNGDVFLSPTISGLTGGDYEFTVSDENGCEQTAGPFTVEKQDGPEIDDTNIVIQPAECGEANGQISGIIVQGDGISYYWNNNQSPTLDLTGLSSGSYLLDVIDVNGCEASSGPYEISNIGGPEVDTSAIITENASCGSSDGFISGIVATGDNLTYSWNGQPSDSINISDLAPGDYSLTATDDQGCQTTVGPFTITGDPGPIVNDDSLEIVLATCTGNDGAIIGLQIQGDSLRYFWNGVEHDSVNLVNINTGDYTLEVIDKGGCAVTYGPISITQEQPFDTWATPDYQLIDAGDNVQINVGVEDPGSIVSAEWTPTGRLSCSDCSDPVANPITTTEYTVTVVTSDGCTSEHIVRIEVNAICGDLHIPDNFSPNNDGLNEELCVYGGCVAEYSLQIYNRWGELIFSSEDASECWDGTYRGKELNAAIYVYQLRAKLTDGTEIEKKGNLNLFR